MIQSITINDNKNLPGKSYISELDTFQNGKKYEFKPGINIIIGNNGCGKTTLLDMIANYTFCHRTMFSEIPNDVLDFPELFDFFGDSNDLRDGASLKCDYAGVVYKYMPTTEMDKDRIMGSSESFFSYMENGSNSTGEKMINSLDTMFGVAFNNKNVQFPIEDLVKRQANFNNVWRDRVRNLLQYYKENAIKISRSEFQFTFLIDEPDRNLDIDNIDTIYKILSHRKEYTQIIAVVHNPILIYKLSKLGYIHFIEMTEGYLNKVNKVFNNL